MNENIIYPSMVIRSQAEAIELLEKENKQLKEKINTYEDPEDMTLMYMWCDSKAKDKIKELQTKVEFLDLSNPEQNIRHWEIINENRRKIGNLRKQIKDLKEIEKEHQKINGELREENKALKEQLKELNRHLDASTVSEEEWLDYAINYNLEQLEKRCMDE